MPVTRAELAALVSPAFDRATDVRRPELIRAATDTGARPEVIAALQSLSDDRFRQVRDLWRELGHLPIELDGSPVT